MTFYESVFGVTVSVLIHLNNLVYMDWRVKPLTETTCVSLEELHMQSNHMPYEALQRLVKEGLLDSLLNCMSSSHMPESFCEDCISGKLTCAPHTKLVLHANAPLSCMYTDIHSLLPTRS